MTDRRILTRRFMVDLRGRVVTGNIFRNEPVVQIRPMAFNAIPKRLTSRSGRT